MTTPRNQPCPCKSGKKFKKCCGSAAMLAERKREEEVKFMEARRARVAEREKQLAERGQSGEFKHRRSGAMPMIALLAASMGAIGMGDLGRIRRK
jgi:hypothetical protein